MMRSISETSYGARIGNAEKLITALQTFTNYQPQKPALSIAEFSSKIEQIKNQNITIASKRQTYSMAVEARQQKFEKDIFSVKKTLSPINATVKASFGREAKEATDIAGIISKIRGANAKNAKTANAVQVSQSYQSYSSRTQFFSDLITYLENFDTNYNPSNNKLTIVNLKTLLEEATVANNLVMNSYSQFITTNDSRVADYYNLSQIAIRIKDNVKSQYGSQSSEYTLVKGLKI